MLSKNRLKLTMGTHRLVMYNRYKKLNVFFTYFSLKSESFLKLFDVGTLFDIIISSAKVCVNLIHMLIPGGSRPPFPLTNIACYGGT